MGLFDFFKKDTVDPYKELEGLKKSQDFLNERFEKKQIGNEDYLKKAEEFRRKIEKCEKKIRKLEEKQ